MSEAMEFDPEGPWPPGRGAARSRPRRRALGSGVEPLPGEHPDQVSRSDPEDPRLPERFLPGSLSADGNQLVQDPGGNWPAMANPLLGTPAMGVPMAGTPVPGLPPAGSHRPAWSGTSTPSPGTPRAGLPLSQSGGNTPNYPPARPRARRPNRALGATPAAGLPDPAVLPPPSLPRGLPAGGIALPDHLGADPFLTSAYGERPAPRRPRSGARGGLPAEDWRIRRAPDDSPLDPEPRGRRAAAHLRDRNSRDRDDHVPDRDGTGEREGRPERARDRSGRADRSSRPSDRKKSPSVSNAAVGAVTEVLVVVSMALVLALVIKTFLLQAFFIPSESMENTLLVGDRVLVNKLVPGVMDLHRGDVIVFRDPGGWLTPEAPVDEGPVRNAIRSSLTFIGLLPQDSGEHLIKRVIGLPGDVVACCDAQGKITVNGAAIEEPYLFPGNAPSTLDFSVKVPENRLWVMGDHRAVSEDSRYHPTLQQGTISLDDVVGKAFVIVWPLGRAGSVASAGAVSDGVPDAKSPS
ncbi:MAG: signal peptidase [Actinomycetota bacterium]|nr:signal peptidase [Actinomycetota bacterium]